MKLFTLLDLCVSSLRRGHANLFCIVPILTDDPRRESNVMAHRHARIVFLDKKQQDAKCSLARPAASEYLLSNARLQARATSARAPLAERLLRNSRKKSR